VGLDTRASSAGVETDWIMEWNIWIGIEAGSNHMQLPPKRLLNTLRCFPKHRNLHDHS
jgi:hypothetical protein